MAAQDPTTDDAAESPVPEDAPQTGAERPKRHGRRRPAYMAVAALSVALCALLVAPQWPAALTVDGEQLASSLQQSQARLAASASALKSREEALSQLIGSATVTGDELDEAKEVDAEATEALGTEAVTEPDSATADEVRAATEANDKAADTDDELTQEAEDAAGALQEAQKKADKAAQEAAEKKAEESAAEKAAEEKAVQEKEEEEEEAAASSSHANSAPDDDQSPAASSRSSDTPASASLGSSAATVDDAQLGPEESSADSAWSPSYILGSSTDQAALQAAVDSGNLVKVGGYEYFAAHNWTSYGKRIASQPTYVRIDGALWKWAGSTHFADGTAMTAALDYIGSDGLGLQTCENGALLVVKYTRAS